MKHLYLSNYCVLFQDYDWIERCVRSFQDFPIGVEFATSWTTPGFYEELERQVEVFRDIPTTLHAPFVEECTLPGSEAEQYMAQRYQYACDLYPRFGATSMVMHTHEGGFPPEERPPVKSGPWRWSGTGPAAWCARASAPRWKTSASR